MHALVYRSPGAESWENARDAVLQDNTAAIVGIGASTTCGTDLRVQPGDPGVRDVAEASRMPGVPRGRREGAGAS